MEADFSKLDRAFNPRCVAVVGDKKEMNYMWLRGQSNYKGQLYSVQIDPAELEGIKQLGVKNFLSLMDVPDPVDFVIVAVPRPVAPIILEDCIRKQVAAAHFFTSGFAETDTEEGKKLEKILIEKSEAARFHLIGPNCMGIFSPKIGIRQNVNQYTGIDGPIGFISQSGTHAIAFSEEAHRQGLNINKSVSFGNGVVLDATDYLAYFTQDPDIEAIGMYLEGIKDGRRFLKTLKAATSKKPVIIWKGGRTEEGGRAIASHTGSMAVPMTIWNAAVRQCGAVKATGIDELIDTLKAVLYLNPVYGNRVGIAGGSGGQSVAIADIIAEAGLKAPRLTQKTYKELASFFTLIGGSYRNPVDTGNINRRQMKRILDLLEQDENIDNLVYLMTAGARRYGLLESDVNTLVEIRKRTKKPVMSILSFTDPKDIQELKEIIQTLQDESIPSIPTLERGASALKNAFDYYGIQKSMNM